MSAPRFVRNSLLLVGVELLTKILGVVFFAMVARFLGATELGMYAYAIALANFFVLAPKFGFDEWVQREVGRDPARAYPYFWEISAVKGLIAFGSLGLFFLLLAVLGKGNFLLMALAAGFVFLYSFMEFVNAFFRALHRPELELMARGFFSAANISLGALVLYGGGRLPGVVSVQVVSVGAALLMAILILQRVITRVKYSCNWRVLWGHLLAAAPFAGLLLALYFSNQLGIIFLSYFRGKEEVGYFAAAVRFFDNLTLIPAAIMGAFLPVASGYYVTSREAFVRTVRFTFKYLFIISAPLAVGTALLADRIIILLYREAFFPSGLVLQILSLALVCIFWNYACVSVLIARDRERLVFGLTWLGSAIYVAANLLFIPAYSYRGAALAVLVTQSAFFLILMPFVLRHLNIFELLKNMALPTLAVLLMGSFLLVFKGLNLFVAVLSGMAIYAGVLLATGAVRLEEIYSVGMVEKES